MIFTLKVIKVENCPLNNVIPVLQTLTDPFAWLKIRFMTRQKVNQIPGVALYTNR